MFRLILKISSVCLQLFKLVQKNCQGGHICRVESDGVHEPLFTFSYRDTAACNKANTKQERDRGRDNRRDGEEVRKWNLDRQSLNAGKPLFVRVASVGGQSVLRQVEYCSP